jgi:hypothetical protein
VASSIFLPWCGRCLYRRFVIFALVAGASVVGFFSGNFIWIMVQLKLGLCRKSLIFLVINLFVLIDIIFYVVNVLLFFLFYVFMLYMIVCCGLGLLTLATNILGTKVDAVNAD